MKTTQGVILNEDIRTKAQHTLSPSKILVTEKIGGKVRKRNRGVVNMILETGLKVDTIMWSIIIVIERWHIQRKHFLWKKEE